MTYWCSFAVLGLLLQFYFYFWLFQTKMSQREKNPIWQYFDKSISDTSKAVCKICSKFYSLGSHKPKKQTLHGLKLHLSKFHDKEYRQILKRLSELNDFKSEAKLKRSDLVYHCNNRAQISRLLFRQPFQVWHLNLKLYCGLMIMKLFIIIFI